MTALVNVFVHLTRACDLRCSYCYFSAAEPMEGELRREEWAAVWPQLVAVGPRKVVLTGGEPMLRPDLPGILADLRAADPGHRVLRCLNTNGGRMDRTIARSLVGLVDEVRVSLDGLPEWNDPLRGEGTAARALGALELLWNEGFEPIVLVTVTRRSLPGLEALLELLVERRFTRIHVNAARPLGRARGEDPDEALLDAALARVGARLLPGASDPVCRDPEVQRHCGVGHYLNVLPTGEVYPCHSLVERGFSCGNLREQGFAEVCARLAPLTALDFTELAREDPRLAALLRPRACMGVVHAATRDAAPWRRLR